MAKRKAETTAGRSIPIRKELLKKHVIWSRIRALIHNDEDQFLLDTFCRRLPNETVKAYKFRQKFFSLGFTNPTMELLMAPGATIFGNDTGERFTESEGRLARFSENVSRSVSDPLPLWLFLKDSFVPHLGGYGTVFMVMDMPQINGDTVTEEQQAQGRIWPYLTILDPQTVRNYEFCDGELQWFAYDVDHSAPWLDPLTKQPPESRQTRIWTREEYIITEAAGLKIKSRRPNPFGFVPVVIQASFRPEVDSVLGVAPFFTSSNSIIAANNHLNVVNMEIWKHASAMLMIHKQSLIAENTAVDKSGDMHLKVMAEDGAMVWYGEHKPDFLTRDLAVIEHAKNQYEEYIRAAFENEKSARSVGKMGYGGKDVGQAPSGIAKVIDRDPIVAKLIATAIDTQHAHRKILSMAARMINPGIDAETQFELNYDTVYDITPFATLLDNAERLTVKIKVPSETVIRSMYKRIAASVIDDPALLEIANKEIDEADVLHQRGPDFDLETMLADARGDDGAGAGGAADGGSGAAE